MRSVKGWGQKLASIFVLALVMLGALTSVVRAEHFTVDKARSERLTRYLRNHRLPLVGAEVQQGDDGSRRLMLYGFVATEFGKADAERKAVKYLHEPDIEVLNHINVQPEIRHLKRKPQTSAEPSARRSPDMDTGAPEPAEEPWESQCDELIREGTGVNPPASP